MDKEKINGFLEAGSDILSRVDGAVKTGDYSSLNSQIRTTLKNTIGNDPTASETVTKQADRRSTMQQQMAETMRKQRERNAAMSMYSGRLKRTDSVSVPNAKKPEVVNSKKKFEATPFARRKVSKLQGVGEIAVGIIISLLTIISSLWIVIAAALVGGGTASGVTGMILLLILVFAVILIVRGAMKNKLARRFNEYAVTVGNKGYITVKDLGNASGQTEKETLKSLTQMKKAGYLPYAEFDESRTTMMFTEEVIDEYKMSMKARLEEERLELAKRAAEENLPTDTLNLIEEGETYIKKVRAYNDRIADSEEMSDKLYRMEDTMKRIFERVRKNPSNTGYLRKFMSYYLPTTEKLLDAYISLSDSSAGNGENVVQTKAEIEETMDTLCSAYENILDEMFDDIALDISSDISVMKTMMQQDGIAPERGFKENNDNK
ncbi:5-bromo-4-chloroindolyl phosphate hydrolysis family protein [Lachnospiraceae bacterium C1.1]|nr:5-bromo-4-chloroindolyl phosphate hydrolysis family protein [Lachnospiraceae bacterium C1.1]